MISPTSHSHNYRSRRKLKVRRKIAAITDLPRLTVFRSNKYIYAQIINDRKKQTIAAASEADIKASSKLTKLEKAKLVGKTLAQKAKKKKATKVVFDRGAYKYHGRIKALAEAAKAEGLNF